MLKRTNLTFAWVDLKPTLLLTTTQIHGNLVKFISLKSS